MPEEYNPELDFTPNPRDIFAMNEGTSPIIQTPEEMAKFLGIHVDEVNRKGMRILMPKVFAKWRYLCADAMIEARKRQRGL